MGYNITIGNAELYTEPEDLRAGYTVQWIKNEDAIHIENDDTDKTNSRSPSYTVFTEWAREVGLSDYFGNKETGLMREHPGIFKLSDIHLKEIRLAIEKYKTKHPDVKPGFWLDDSTDWTKSIEDPTLSPSLARLVWFEYWIDWALKNCEIPAIENT